MLIKERSNIYTYTHDISYNLCVQQVPRLRTPWFKDDPSLRMEPTVAKFKLNTQWLKLNTQWFIAQYYCTIIRFQLRYT